MDSGSSMKYEDWMRLVRKQPHKDLNGRYIVSIYGKLIGEIVYREGIVISRKKLKIGRASCRERV